MPNLRHLHQQKCPLNEQTVFTQQNKCKLCALSGLAREGLMHTPFKRFMRKRLKSQTIFGSLKIRIAFALLFRISHHNHLATHTKLRNYNLITYMYQMPFIIMSKNNISRLQSFSYMLFGTRHSWYSQIF